MPYLGMVNKSKKNLLYFIPQFPVRSETFIEREVSKLVEFGNLNITILSQAAGTGVLSENLNGRVVYQKITLADCVKAFFDYFVLHPSKAYQVHKLILGEDHIPYFFNFSSKQDLRTKLSVLGRFHNSRFVHFLKGLAYAKVFEKYSPDHIHAQFLSDTSTIVMVAAKMLDVPFSVSAHAKDVFVEGSLISIKAREAKFISVCNGNTWREVVKQANLTKSSGKVKLLFHGIDPQKFFNVLLPTKPDVPLIFTIGRLVEKKGIRYLIEASEILVSRGIAHVVKVGGGGPLYDELQGLVRQKKLETHFEILGDAKDAYPNDQIAGWLQVADIYAAPFIVADSGDVDGVPTSVIEAALAKLPIVATDSGSMDDLVTSQTGLIISQKDSVALADALEKLLNDRELRVKLGEVVYNQALSQFNIDKNIGDMERLLLE